MKKNIYITYDLELKRDGNILKVGDKKVPLSIIDNVFIIGNARLKDSARKLLLKYGKSVFFLNRKYELTGLLTPPTFDSSYRLRLNQYKRVRDLEIAKYIVQKKIEEIQKQIDKSLARYLKKIGDVKNHDELMGIEGKASLYMFEKFRENLEKEGIYDFERRMHRPVKDRVNGLLSFLYTLYYALMYSLLISEGFDPYISFLHVKRGKHVSLASDLMEVGRVKLTFLAIDILKEIYKDGFVGLYLNDEARRFVLREFDKFVIDYENLLIKDVKGLLL